MINQLRAILLERGIVIAQGRRNLEHELDAMLCEEDGLAVSPRLRMLIEGIREEWRGLDQRIAAFDDEFAARAKTDEAARRLATIPGIGVLNATALAAAIGEGETFARGRDLAAWLGLVPRQITTGGKPRLVGITKRGNCYLRKLLIHGARAVLPTLSKNETPLGAWLRALLARVHKNAAVVAFALVSSPRTDWPWRPVSRRHVPVRPGGHCRCFALIGIDRDTHAAQTAQMHRRAAGLEPAPRARKRLAVASPVLAYCFTLTCKASPVAYRASKARLNAAATPAR